jgi:hypothetical protein
MKMLSFSPSTIKLCMTKELTAQQVIDRIRIECGDTWRTSATDAFSAGIRDAQLRGLASHLHPGSARGIYRSRRPFLADLKIDLAFIFIVKLSRIVPIDAQNH